MLKPIGGRGHVASYGSTHVRVPTPLKEQVKELIDRYYEFLAEGGDPLEPERLLDKNTACKPVNEFISKPVNRFEAVRGGKAVESTEQEVLSKAIKSFIAKKQQQYGANNAQKHKPFSTDSRSWDYFKEFAELVQNSEGEIT